MTETEPLPLDPDELRRRYDEERDKRVAAGVRDYVDLVDITDSEFDRDPYAEPLQRDAIAEETDVVIVGAGWGGMTTAAFLTDHGVTNYRIIDKAGDFGGTWYWNRYPGCQCDVESYTYLPLLERTGYMPTKRYATAPGDLRVRATTRAKLRHVPARAVPDERHRDGMERTRPSAGE